MAGLVSIRRALLLGIGIAWFRDNAALAQTTTLPISGPLVFLASSSTSSGSSSSSSSSATSGAGAVSQPAADALTTLVGTRTINQGNPTGNYSIYSSQITLSAASNVSTTLTGSASLTTTSQAGPTNTQPCNNYVEFCSRRYSNITVVGTHNSPFVRVGSSASNQQIDVTGQLNDGIRFLQGQMQWPSDATGVAEPHFCHTSCDILDAGPISQWLTQVREWIDGHPYDVVTILLGNGNYSTVSLYAPWIEKSGIVKYLYRPTVFPMRLKDWPTLEEMILSGTRAVMFMDYESNQQEVPWVIDQFSQMWESPFDPVDRSFPCTVDRPPNLSEDDTRNNFLSLVNHNLNVEFNLFGAQILVPAVSLLNQTNAAEGNGSLGDTARNCTAMWGRPPNFLNVDYYNFGSPPGSVFTVAAQMNNVTYNGSCCGVVQSEGVERAAAWCLALVVALLTSLALS